MMSPRGPAFNHTTNYATAVRWPAEEQAGDLICEPRSPLRAHATCPAFCSPPPLLCITTAKPPTPTLPHPTVRFMRDNEWDLFANQGLHKGEVCHNVAARSWGANGAEQVGIESQSLLRVEKKRSPLLWWHREGQREDVTRLWMPSDASTKSGGVF